MQWTSLACLAGLLLLAGMVQIGVRRWIGLRKKKVTEEQRVEAAKQKRMMEDLISHPGWTLLENAANAQMKYRTDAILLDPDLPGEKSKYLAGEASGIKSFLAIPKALIDGHDAVLQAWEQQEEEGN